jgi:hypothetical protein
MTEGAVPPVAACPLGSLARPATTPSRGRTRKGETVMRRSSLYPRVVSLVIVALLLAAAGPALASHKNPQVVPINKKAYGHRYQGWAEQWWQWALGLPLENHPLFDGTGHPEFDPPGSACAVGQEGKVWFLGGVFSATGEADRTCTVPAGKALFFPILNAFGDNNGVNPPQKKKELKEGCDAFIDDPTTLAVTLDDKSLRHLRKFRIEPSIFSYTLPAEPNLIDFLVGNPNHGFPDSPPPPGAVSCGYYVLLHPLPAGEHTLRIQASIPVPPPQNVFSLDVEYELTVSG